MFLTKKEKPLKRVATPFVPNVLGDIFNLPFGEYRVMNHYHSARGMVYVEGMYGMYYAPFLDALKTIDAVIKHGIVIPDKINVIDTNGRVFEGRYLELVKIVEAINEMITKDDARKPYRHVTVVKSPVSERMVKAGAYGEIDVARSQIRVGGNWFTFDDRWTVTDRII